MAEVPSPGALLDGVDFELEGSDAAAAEAAEAAAGGRDGARPEGEGSDAAADTEQDGDDEGDDEGDDAQDHDHPDEREAAAPSGRKPLHSCSEAEFIDDLMDFLRNKGQYSLLPPVGGASEFPMRNINGKKVDLFNLYKQICKKGGFRVGANLKRVAPKDRLNWTGEVFPAMRNYSYSFRGTSVGVELVSHYKTYLADYEVAHLEDVQNATFLSCDAEGNGVPEEGLPVEVYWKGDKMWYPGTVEAPGSGPTKRWITYDDGDYDEADFAVDAIRLFPVISDATGAGYTSHQSTRSRSGKRKRRPVMDEPETDEDEYGVAPDDMVVVAAGPKPLEKMGKTAAEALFGLAFSRGSYWDDWRVGEWLAERGLGEYAQLFEEHEVDLSTLPHLTMEDLVEMEVLDRRVRERMLIVFASAAGAGAEQAL